jgi:hypothetical protein
MIFPERRESEQPTPTTTYTHSKCRTPTKTLVSIHTLPAPSPKLSRQKTPQYYLHLQITEQETPPPGHHSPEPLSTPMEDHQSKEKLHPALQTYTTAKLNGTETRAHLLS